MPTLPIWPPPRVPPIMPAIQGGGLAAIHVCRHLLAYGGHSQLLESQIGSRMLSSLRVIAASSSVPSSSPSRRDDDVEPASPYQQSIGMHLPLKHNCLPLSGPHHHKPGGPTMSSLGLGLRSRQQHPPNTRMLSSWQRYLPSGGSLRNALEDPNRQVTNLVIAINLATYLYTYLDPRIAQQMLMVRCKTSACMG